MSMALPVNNEVFDEIMTDVFTRSSCILGSVGAEKSRKSELFGFLPDLLEIWYKE